MSSTAKMGRSAEDACVDSRFRVFGLNALRVVDMSVAPFVPRYVNPKAGERECILTVSQLPHSIHSIHLRRACKRDLAARLWLWRRDQGKTVGGVQCSHISLCYSVRAIAEGTAMVGAIVPHKIASSHPTSDYASTKRQHKPLKPPPQQP